MTLETDTFTMPIVDEIVEAGAVVRQEERMNSGILIKIMKNREEDDWLKLTQLIAVLIN